MERLSFLLSDQSLLLLPEYHQRVEVKEQGGHEVGEAWWAVRLCSPPLSCRCSGP